MGGALRRETGALTDNMYLFLVKMSNMKIKDPSFHVIVNEFCHHLKVSVDLNPVYPEMAYLQEEIYPRN